MIFTAGDRQLWSAGFSLTLPQIPAHIVTSPRIIN
jgi:hypothetical protein